VLRLVLLLSFLATFFTRFLSRLAALLARFLSFLSTLLARFLTRLLATAIARCVGAVNVLVDVRHA
jgi:hypothetical protein